jgi:hypothetical protein
MKNKYEYLKDEKRTPEPCCSCQSWETPAGVSGGAASSLLSSRSQEGEALEGEEPLGQQREPDQQKEE